MPQIHSGHRERMRERFLENGLDGFADHEVLELLLFFAIPQRDVNPLAHKLLEHFGSLHRVLDSEIEELMQVEGVGRYSATLLKLFSAVSARLRKSRNSSRIKLRNCREACDYCVDLMAGKRDENFYLICMSGDMEIIATALVSKGTVNEVSAYPRKVAELALRHDAHMVLLCHNHPNSRAFPSQMDLETTAALCNTLEGIGVVLTDHIIVSGEETFSLEANRLITRETHLDRVVTRVATSAGDVRLPAKLDKQKDKGKQHEEKTKRQKT